MPTTKEFKAKKQTKNAKNKSFDEGVHAEELDLATVETLETDTPVKRNKRRPGRQVEEDMEETASSADDTDTEAEELEASAESNEDEAQLSSDDEANQMSFLDEERDESTSKHRSGSDEDLARLEREAEEPEAGPRIEINFKGSELLRSRFPKPFDIAETVATDWVYGGEFDKLPIDQPLAKFAAQTGLQKAKEIEKKVLESPAFEKAAIQALTYGMKAQGFISELRSKMKR